MATRMSHAECTHPKTSSARAKCREAYARVERVRAQPEEVLAESRRDPMSLSQMLEQARRERREINERLEESDHQINLLREALKSKFASQEPKTDHEGNPTVVAFVKRFGNRVYSYSAIGVVARRQQIFDPSSYSVHSESPWYDTQEWYVTGATTKPYSWSELVDFIGESNVASLEILRGVYDV